VLELVDQILHPDESGLRMTKGEKVAEAPEVSGASQRHTVGGGDSSAFEILRSTQDDKGEGPLLTTDYSLLSIDY
jgi:hypothetical protein